MAHRITLPEPLYETLRREAQRVQLSPDVLAERLLAQGLSTELSAWREAVEALISRVQARTAGFSAEEIEADITAAAEEARKARRARRHSR